MRSLVYIFCLLGGGVVQAELNWTVGLGLESHLVHEVNPANSSLVNLGQLFAQVEFAPLSLSLELSEYRHQTSAGLIAIDAQTLNAMLWTRYQFENFKGWIPLVGFGSGVAFDRITSTYADQSDNRRGRRWLNGVGAGARYVAWQIVAFEGEARLLVLPDQRDPEFGFAGRVGVQF